MDDLDRLYPGIDKPIHVFEQQAIGSEERTIEKALKQTFVGLTEANEHVREPVPVSKLTIGMECGGSDGFSGISANPAIGRCSDLLAELGGSGSRAEFRAVAGQGQDIEVPVAAGQPLLDKNHKTYYSQTPKEMASQLSDLLEADAYLIGGCCGTGPAHIKAFRQTLDAHLKKDSCDGNLHS